MYTTVHLHSRYGSIRVFAQDERETDTPTLQSKSKWTSSLKEKVFGKSPDVRKAVRVPLRGGALSGRLAMIGKLEEMDNSQKK